MSLFSSLILPSIEEQLVKAEPQVAEFLLGQLKNAASEVFVWAESKLNVDLNGDGKIGDKE